MNLFCNFRFIVVCTLTIVCWASPRNALYYAPIMDNWEILPRDVHMDDSQFHLWMIHLGASVLQTAGIDGYGAGINLDNLKKMVANAMLREHLHRFARRWNFKEAIPEGVRSKFAPHIGRNYVACPLYRQDRESPIIAQSMRGDLVARERPWSRAYREQLAWFFLFARRTIHQWPPGWIALYPFLETQLDANVDFGSQVFCENFINFVNKESYGRWSQWW